MTPTGANWILATLCLALSAPLIFVNWHIVAFNWRHRHEGKHSSWVPLLGGVAGTLAIWFAPLPALKPWCLPLLLDFGCFTGMSWTAIFWFGSYMGWHKPNYTE